MTLIAAFRCVANDQPGVVVCADSQETRGVHRVTVEKIKPRDAENYELVIGGSGNIGELIDGQADAVERNVKHWPAGLDEESARLRLENALRSFNARQVINYPIEVPKDSPEYKVMHFIVCVRDKTTSQIYLWRAAGTKVARAGEYELVGWDEEVFYYEVERLFKQGLSPQRAVLLGVHLFTIAENILYVGGDTQVIVVRNNSTHLQDPARILAYKEQVRLFNTALSQLALATPDTSIHDDDFLGLLKDVETRVMQLRKQYLERAAEDLLNRAHDPNYRGGAIQAVPIGTLMSRGADGKVTISSREETQAFMETMRRQAALNDLPSDSETSEGQQ